MNRYYKLLLLALGLSLTLNASASHVNFLTLPDYKDTKPDTGIEVTGVVGQASANLSFLIRNNTNNPLKFLRYSTSGVLTTSMLQYIQPSLTETETGYCFIPGTLSPNTAVAPHNTCTASFTIDTSHITKPGTYKTWLVVEDEWDVKSKPLLINLHMEAAGGGGKGGSLAVLPDTSEAYSSPAVKRILVHNSKATVIPKLNIAMTNPDSPFILYDGNNGSEDSHKGPWCTPVNCPDHCVANNGLPAHGTCYVYVKAKSNVDVGVPAEATLKIGEGSAATEFTLHLTNQALLYVGGIFTNEWGIPYVAAYDGDTWYDIGSGIAVLPFNGLIGALTTDVRGNLYAGGNFNLGGIHYVAKYDDFAWNGIGAGPAQMLFKDPIFTLLFGSQGNLYAGGKFEDGNGNKYIAQYDPKNEHWLNFGNGPENTPFNENINALLADPDGNIYAAGDFSDPNKNNERYVAKKSIMGMGAKWSDIGSAGATEAIESMVMNSEKNLYADMYQVDGSGEPQYYIGEYNASAGQWYDIGPTATHTPAPPFEFDDTIYTLVIGADDNLYVAGDFTDAEGDRFVAKYDTKTRTWSDIGFGPEDEPFNGSIRTLVADNNGALYAAGDFNDDDEWEERYVARYNTEGWSDIGTGPVDSPFNGIIVSMAIGHRLFINEED